MREGVKKGYEGLPDFLFRFFSAARASCPVSSLPCGQRVKVYPAHVPVGCKPPVLGFSEIQVADNGRRPEVKMLLIRAVISSSVNPLPVPMVSTIIETGSATLIAYAS